MNAIQIPKKTMSSREIAELTGKRHDNVMRVIRDCGDILTPQFEDTPNSQNGVLYKQALLGKRDSLVLVARLSPEFTAVVIDRWQELEEKQSVSLPKSFSEALQLAADQAKQLEEAAPKLQVYEALAERTQDVATTALAKQLGISAIKLNRFLKIEGIKCQYKDYPAARYAEWFNVVPVTKNGHEGSQCLITPKGQIEITKRYKK